MLDFLIDTYAAVMCCVAVWAVLDCIVRACSLIADMLTERRETIH
jgi:hypothetical protein